MSASIPTPSQSGTSPPQAPASRHPSTRLYATAGLRQGRSTAHSEPSTATRTTGGTAGPRLRFPPAHPAARAESPLPAPEPPRRPALPEMPVLPTRRGPSKARPAVLHPRWTSRRVCCAVCRGHHRLPPLLKPLRRRRSRPRPGLPPAHRATRRHRPEPPPCLRRPPRHALPERFRKGQAVSPSTPVWRCAPPR